MENLIPTISVIATILLVGLALGTLILNGHARLENRLVAVEKVDGADRWSSRRSRAHRPDEDARPGLT